VAFGARFDQQSAWKPAESHAWQEILPNQHRNASTSPKFAQFADKFWIVYCTRGTLGATITKPSFPNSDDPICRAIERLRAASTRLRLSARSYRFASGLLSAQAREKAFSRFESGDPSLARPAHVSEAWSPQYAGKTPHVPNNGIPELRAALADKVRTRTDSPGVTSNDVFRDDGGDAPRCHITFGALLSPGERSPSFPIRCGRKSPRTFGSLVASRWCALPPSDQTFAAPYPQLVRTSARPGRENHVVRGACTAVRRPHRARCSRRD